MVREWLVSEKGFQDWADPGPGAIQRIRELVGEGRFRCLTYSLAGGVLALSSPLGWIALTWLSESGETGPWWPWLGAELVANLSLYLYLWIGATLGFMAFGAALGLLQDKIEEKVSGLQILEEMFRDLSQKDPLTGLGNYRGFIGRIHEELEVPRGSDRNLSVLMLDLDHLKELNDRRGHMAGDVALQKVAHAIQKTIRLEDYAARYGGDEFVVLLREAGPLRAKDVAMRLHAALEDGGTEESHPTVSIGLVTVEASEHLAPKEILSRADQALYLAKREGRDQTRVFA